MDLSEVRKVFESLSVDDLNILNDLLVRCDVADCGAIVGVSGCEYGPCQDCVEVARIESDFLGITDPDWHAFSSDDGCQEGPCVAEPAVADGDAVPDASDAAADADGDVDAVADDTH